MINSRAKVISARSLSEDERTRVADLLQLGLSVGEVAAACRMSASASLDVCGVDDRPRAGWRL